MDQLIIYALLSRRHNFLSSSVVALVVYKYVPLILWMVLFLMLVFSRVICSNHLEKLLLVRQNFRSFIGNLTADYVIRTEAFIHLFWVLTHVVTNLQPAAHGKLDPAVLASLPPSMQLDLLVQVRLIMDTAHKTLIYLYIYIYIHIHIY